MTTKSFLRRKFNFSTCCLIFPFALVFLLSGFANVFYSGLLIEEAIARRPILYEKVRLYKNMKSLQTSLQD